MFVPERIFGIKFPPTSSSETEGCAFVCTKIQFWRRNNQKAQISLNDNNRAFHITSNTMTISQDTVCGRGRWMYVNKVIKTMHDKALTFIYNKHKIYSLGKKTNWLPLVLCLWGSGNEWKGQQTYRRPGRHTSAVQASLLSFPIWNAPSFLQSNTTQTLTQIARQPNEWALSLKQLLESTNDSMWRWIKEFICCIPLFALRKLDINNTKRRQTHQQLCETVGTTELWAKYLQQMTCSQWEC